MSIQRRWPHRLTALGLVAIALLAILLAWLLAKPYAVSEPPSTIQAPAATAPIPQAPPLTTSARQIIKTPPLYPEASSAQAQMTPLLALDNAIKQARSEIAERCPSLDHVQPPEHAAELPISMQEASQDSENSLRNCRKNISLANPFVSTKQ